MKKLICLLLIFIAVTVPYTEIRMVGYVPALTLNEYGYYTGFALATENYSPEQAAADGCVVLFEFEELANTVLWQQFLDDSQAGRPSAVRIAQFYENFASLTDVIYTGGRYHVFYSDSEFYTDIAYDHLLILRGTVPQAAYESWVAVLTNEPTLTFEQVMDSFLSSDADPETPPFAWVRIGIGDATA